MSKKNIAIGIDLGTTYSCVGVYQNKRVEIIANDQGNRTMPSYVGFTDTERLIGESAKNAAMNNPTNTIYDAKRLIGMNYDDPSIADDLRNFSFEVVNRGNKPYVKAKYLGENKEFTPEEISAMVLTKMKQTAQNYLGSAYEVKDAVITVPAYFNDAQRRATKDAGTIAGLNVIRIINEPTAAAIAYGFDENIQGEKRILVVDSGGGTTDLSVLELSGGIFEVLSTGGDTHLGGEDIDNALVNYIVSEYQRKNNVSLRENKRAIRRIRTAVERAKIVLSSSMSTNIELDAIHEGNDFSMTITRARFESMCGHVFSRILKPIDDVLRDAKLSKGEIDEIILVGGTTRIPKIQEMLKDYFGKDPNRSINPDEAVAYGACIQAAHLTKGQSDEGLTDMLLLDIVPLSLGIAVQGSVMSVLIPKGTTIPAKKMDTFSTAVDNQSGVSVEVFEGERKLVKDNNRLGQFQLDGIPPAPRGVPQIEISFNIDANGMLNVSAKDKSSGKSKNITITNDSNRLSKEEIERMVADAEKYKEEDDKIMKKIEAKNKLEGYCFSIRSSMLNEPSTKEKLGSDATILETKVNEMLSWLDMNSDATIEEYEEKYKELEKIVLPITSKLYSSGGETHSQSQPSQSSKSDGPSIEEID